MRIYFIFNVLLFFVSLSGVNTTLGADPRLIRCMESDFKDIYEAALKKGTVVTLPEHPREQSKFLERLFAQNSHFKIKLRSKTSKPYPKIEKAQTIQSMSMDEDGFFILEADGSSSKINSFDIDQVELIEDMDSFSPRRIERTPLIQRSPRAAAISSTYPTYLSGAKLYARLQRLFDLPIPSNVRTSLQRRWKNIEKKKNAFHWDDYSKIKTAQLEVSRDRHPVVIDQMIENQEMALTQIKKWIEVGQDLDKNRLIELHQILAKKIRDDQGRPVSSTLRKQRIAAGRDYRQELHQDRHLCTDPEQLEQAMEDLLAWYNTHKDRIHPIEIAAGMHQRLVSVHFFTNANGRFARTVTDWILTSRGYPPALFTETTRNTALFARMDANRNLPPGENVIRITEAIEKAMETLWP